MTGAPSKGVMGQFVKLDTVATRKVVRLHIECPIEQADDILLQLGGFPDPSEAQWVAVAPLAMEPETTLKGGALAQQAGILCNDPEFEAYCREEFGCDTVDAIYRVCHITSRAYLDHSKSAATQFRKMRDDFDFWKRTNAGVL